MNFTFGKVLDAKNAIPGTRQSGAKFALVVLTCINLLNFADRYVTSAVKELIKEDMNLSDTETALPTTGMVVVYVISATLFGFLADKQIVDRRYVLCGAIVFWSLATASAGLAQNLEQLIVLRSLVGVGEAAYSTIAPPLISDFFPKKDRNIAFSIYYLAIPVGGALGFGVGAVLGAAFNWRVAFLGVGLPGIAASVCVLLCNNPVHGLNDPEHHDLEKSVALVECGPPFGSGEYSGPPSEEVTRNPLTPPAGGNGQDDTTNSDGGSEIGLIQRERGVGTMEGESNTSSPLSSSFDRMARDVQAVLTNKVFMVATAGTVANNFALGGLAEWFPAYLTRFFDADIGEAGLVVGAATIVGGIGGCVLGAKTAQHYAPTVKSAFFLVSAIYTLPATLFLILLLNATSSNMVGVAYFLLLIAEIFVWTGMAPISTVAINAIPPNLRATSCGLSIVLQHVLGDMISPPIIGAISDGTGSLRTGLQITWVTTLISGLCWWAGYKYLPPLPVGLTTSISVVTALDETVTTDGVTSDSNATKEKEDNNETHETTFYELLFVRTDADMR